MTTVYGPVKFEGQLIQNFVLGRCYPVKVAYNNIGGSAATITYQKFDGQVIGPRTINPSEYGVHTLSNIHSFSIDTTTSSSILVVEIVTADEEIDPKYLGSPQSAVGGVGGAKIGVIDARQIRRLTGEDEITISNSFLDVNITNSTVDVAVSGTVAVTASNLTATISGVLDAYIVGPAYLNVQNSGIISAQITNSTLNANITNSSLNTNITNSLVNTTVSGIVNVSGSTLNATVTNATINVSGVVLNQNISYGGNNAYADMLFFSPNVPSIVYIVPPNKKAYLLAAYVTTVAPPSSGVVTLYSITLGTSVVDYILNNHSLVSGTISIGTGPANNVIIPANYLMVNAALITNGGFIGSGIIGYSILQEPL